jgi:hypothetical protein
MKVDHILVTGFCSVHGSAPDLSQGAAQFIGSHTAIAQKRHAKPAANIGLLPAPDQKPRCARLSKTLQRINELRRRIPIVAPPFHIATVCVAISMPPL